MACGQIQPVARQPGCLSLLFPSRAAQGGAWGDGQAPVVPSPLAHALLFSRKISKATVLSFGRHEIHSQDQQFL